MYPYFLQKRANSKSSFARLRSASSEMHHMNPSTPHLHTSWMHERLGGLQICPRRPPCPPSHHPCSWRLVPTKSRESTGAGTSPLQITRAAIRAEAFLVEMMDTTHREPRAGSPARVNEACHPRGRPTTPFRSLQSSLHPRVLACIVHTHAGSPAKSAMSSHVFCSLMAVSPSVQRVCVVSDKNRIHIKALVHIFPKRSSRRTCRNSTSEV